VGRATGGAGVEIRVGASVPAPPAVVWGELARIGDHVRWMRDAAAIEFVGDRREGVGTTFDCDTRVGPLRLRDRMQVVVWEPERALGVRHLGAVGGEGRFELTPAGSGTRLEWVERLRFPWWLGGPIGARVARVVLRRTWRANLAAFSELVARREADRP
jgi:hypothetical protein